VKPMSPHAEARRDQERSKSNPVKTWDKMTDEEKAAYKAKWESVDSQAAMERARLRAEQARRGRR